MEVKLEWEHQRRGEKEEGGGKGEEKNQERGREEKGRKNYSSSLPIFKGFYKQKISR